MTESVTLPVWLFAILLAAALWAALDRLLVPGVRWYFRRRMNRVIQEIGARLNIELPQFKLTRRQVLIDRLFHDPRVQAAVEKECRDKDLPRGVVAARVDLRMLTLRYIVREKEGLYRANAEDEALLAYYANAIEPLVAAAVGKQSLAAAQTRAA